MTAAVNDADPLPEQFVQLIPRPESFRPGGLAPWASRTGGSSPARVGLDEVRQALCGEVGAAGAAPEATPASAVLVAVWEEGGDVRTLLTRRTVWMRSHSAQVAFPGGRLEPGETLVDGALREAQEEVGIDPSSVEVVGRLSHLYTVSSDAGMYPVVGILPGRPSISVNPAEVDRAFDVSLGQLMSDGVFHEEIWPVGGTERSVYFFEVAGETVWGATAWVLHELLGLLSGRKLPPATGPVPGPAGASPPAPV